MSNSVKSTFYVQYTVVYTYITCCGKDRPAGADIGILLPLSG